MATVRKRRETFHLTFQAHELEILLDTAEEPGPFAEIETLAANETDLAAAQQAVLALAAVLGLTEVEPRPTFVCFSRTGPRLPIDNTMLVVMQSEATTAEVDQVLAAVREMGLTPHPMPGPTRTAIGITGNTGAVDSHILEVLPGVLELIRVTKPYKLASREMHRHDTVITLPQGTIGGPGRVIIAGPCSVENETMLFARPTG